MKRRAGDKHHLHELQSIESLLFHAFDLEGFYDKLMKVIERRIGKKDTVTIEDLREIDNWMKKEFSEVMPEVERWIVRAFVVGKLVQGKEQSRAPQMKRIDIEALPSKVKHAAAMYKLNLGQTTALNWSVTSGGLRLTSAASDTVTRVQNAIFENVKNRRGTRDLRRELEEEFFNNSKEINRNWQRVAVTEINGAFNQGYLSAMEGGEFVVGFSILDEKTCPHCRKKINGQVFIVVPPEMARDYSNLPADSKEYQRQAWIHENCVWAGKDNHGRSAAPKKRIDIDGGNTPVNLAEREHHEKAMPACPSHPYCRCRWIKFNAAEQYIKVSGDLQMRVMNQEAWQKWFDTVAAPLMQEAKKRGIPVGAKK